MRACSDSYSLMLVLTCVHGQAVALVLNAYAKAGDYDNDLFAHLSRIAQVMRFPFVSSWRFV